MGRKVREFMTHREPAEHIWVERDENALIGTARMGQRLMPRIRPFDLLRNAPFSGGRSQVTIWEGNSLRIAAEQLSGEETQITRAGDYDLLFFQFCGRSTIHSEYRVVDLEPGEMILVPAAIAHRSTGENECLRLRIASREMVNLGVDPEKPLSETQFKVRPSQSFARGNFADGESHDGTLLEHTTFWDPQSDVWIERESDQLIGCVTEGGRGIKKIRAFDYFAGMTGKGGVRAPVLYDGKEFRVDCYNTEGEQRGFHRGCDEDEIWFQFRGHSLNHTEWGALELEPGQTSYVPRGISHRITGGEGFLRMVFYTRQLVHPKAFNNVSERETRFEVQ